MEKALALALANRKPQTAVFPRRLSDTGSPFVRHVRHEARLLIGRVATMSNTSCTLRTRKFMTNRLLARRQFVSARIPEANITPASDASEFPRCGRLRRRRGVARASTKLVK